MKAVVIHGFGGVDQLHIQNVDDPPVGAGEVLVRVRATSVNPIDIKIRNGSAAKLMGVELPAILGRDLAGEVVRMGDGVTGFSKGMRVMAMANGTYAELTTVKADVLAPIPDKLSFEQAAALPLVLITGAQLIERAIKVEPGWTVLILGAVGNVGRTAVHVAQERGAKVIAGVRASQVEEARSLGVQQVISTDDEKQFEKLHDIDAVADTVGGPTAARALKTLKPGGVFGTVVGAPPEASQHNVRVAALVAQPDASRLYELADEVARGSLKIPIAKTLPLDQVQEAHREAENHPSGKIVLKAA
ncbi:MAG TPA: NADP-dependent oxidoreductase [Acidobacteriaceae bacterium]|nr:NADP-dependent oxidoreductase [Acidobacteriaceae bacterium]